MPLMSARVSWEAVMLQLRPFRVSLWGERDEAVKRSNP